ncbi:MAG: extracellular solute-binding protein [Clostridiales bacterium]|nr:extracellular solute-binding protein [Clostridiales bacterium]
MKKNVVKRLLAASMVGTMAIGTLAGCGGGESKDAAKKEEAKTEDTSDKPETWIADRTITVQAYVDDIGNSLPEDFNETPTMKKITELTGIKLDVRYTPGDSDAKVLASQLAAGTIPDVIISYLDNSTRPEFPLLLKAAKEEMFADVSEYIKDSKVFSRYLEDGYLPYDSYQNVSFREDLEGTYLWQMNVDAEDRSLEWDPEERYMGGLYIQREIAEDLGIDVKEIKTQDQFYDLLVKIKEGGYKDANGNDVYPLGPKFWGGSMDTIQYICPGLQWGISDGYNLTADGKVKHEAEMDTIYDEINYVRKLLNEGLMNPEFFTMDSTRAEEVSRNKNSAIMADVHNYVDIIYDSDDWIPLGPLNDISGNNKGITTGKGARGCMAISAEAENPEEIFKFFDWLSTPEGQLIATYGVEGETFDMVDGKPVLKEEVLEAINNNDTEKLVEYGAAFGGSGNYFFEFVLTNRDNKNYFGESRPGASSATTFERSVQLATDYQRELKLIPGLKATAYLSAEELAPVKTQLDLLNWNEVLSQTFFAKTDADVKEIIESFRAQLKAAGVEQFETYVENIYKENPEAVYFIQK